MKPATKKSDAEVWKLWKAGRAPKDIARPAEEGGLGITIAQVYKGIYRERRRRLIPLQRSKRRGAGTNGNKRERRRGRGRR